MSIRVRIDYLPLGDETRAQPLAEVTIQHASADGHGSNFDVLVDGKAKGTVLDHREGAGFWQLVRRAISAVTP